MILVNNFEHSFDTEKMFYTVYNKRKSMSAISFFYFRENSSYVFPLPWPSSPHICLTENSK